ncbi:MULTISPECIES: hypothetical protein [Xanthomonas]|uniref:Uncharacterized protein n=1 Tax=Xanthomonas hawaiiensis TaxID=3003247 RepID=A0ABU2I3M7_9XANT|nr:MULTISPECIES: hypothetical protein [Xanthomonas]MBO9828839.1 hypothetical protein [Xanthomonas sp. A2111]MBO9874515.1 hypothetical protein [Xanthomonas sp. D-93]MCW0424797.1 hypothetical protein [Xanthomonas sacchari]MDS9992741.1 hypothetical protein [Xanthomonas sp. A2111]WNH44504.1 hypothetical protein PG878_18630 [Xanthomonas sp. A6251]
MSTSAPERARHYLADYEAYSFGQRVAWGTLAHTWAEPAPLDPERLLGRLRAQAAQRHGVDSSEIRIRSVSRL